MASIDLFAPYSRIDADTEAQLFPFNYVCSEGASSVSSNSPMVGEDEGMLNVFFAPIKEEDDGCDSLLFPGSRSIHSDSFSDDPSSSLASTDGESPVSVGSSSSPIIPSPYALQQQVEMSSPLYSLPETTSLNTKDLLAPQPQHNPVPGFVPLTPAESKKKRKRDVVDATSPQQHPQPSGKRRKTAADAQVYDQARLSQMSSQELEQLHSALKSQGRLTVEYDHLLKRVLRQVKNRESAQMSRIRKRDHLETVEAELEHERRISSTLRDYNNTLKVLLEKHGIEVPPEPAMPVFVPPEPSELLSESPRSLSRPLRTAGICLVVVVFAVGILFNAVHNASPSSATVAGGEGPLTPQQHPPPSQPASTRVLMNHKASSTEASGSLEYRTPTAMQNEIAESAEVEDDAMDLDVFRRSPYLNYGAEHEASLALVVQSESSKHASQTVSSSPASRSSPSSSGAPYSYSAALVPQASCPVMQYTTKTIFGSAKPHVADRSWAFDNTSYILVNDATEFVPNTFEFDRLQPRTEPVIGLLIPASSFNISNCAPDDVVELVCGVRNATIVPRRILAPSLH